MNQEGTTTGKHEDCEDKLENAELRYQLEKVHKEKALHRCKELEKYVKQLEAHIKKTYAMEDAQAQRISTLQNQSAVKDDIIAEFQRKQEEDEDEKETLENQFAVIKMKYEDLLRNVAEEDKPIKSEAVDEEKPFAGGLPRVIKKLSSQHISKDAWQTTLDETKRPPESLKVEDTMNANVNDRISMKSSAAHKLQTIKAKIEINEGTARNHAECEHVSSEDCDDRQENAELRYQLEKVHNDKALLRWKELEKYVKQLETHIKKSYEIEDAQIQKISTLGFQSSAKDRIIAEFQRKQEEDDEEKETLESQLAAMKNEYENQLRNMAVRNIAFDTQDADRRPFGNETLLIKKLQLGSKDSWNATFDDEEGPVKLFFNDSNDLVIDDIVSQASLLLEGVFTLYDSNPFEVKAKGYGNGRNVSHLLKKVQCCNLTDLFLYHQCLSWKEYERLVTSGTVKNLYFHYVYIKYENEVPVALENIVQKVPTIEKFYLDMFDISYTQCCDVTKETFQKLNRLPCFENLREFKLFYIRYEHFDVESFLDFMNRHQDAHFSISFSHAALSNKEKTKLKMMKQMLESSSTPNQLEVTYY